MREGVSVVSGKLRPGLVLQNGELESVAALNGHRVKGRASAFQENAKKLSKATLQHPRVLVSSLLGVSGAVKFCRLQISSGRLRSLPFLVCSFTSPWPAMLCWRQCINCPTRCIDFNGQLRNAAKMLQTRRHGEYKAPLYESLFHAPPHVVACVLRHSASLQRYGRLRSQQRFPGHVECDFRQKGRKQSQNKILRHRLWVPVVNVLPFPNHWLWQAAASTKTPVIKTSFPGCCHGRCLLVWVPVSVSAGEGVSLHRKILDNDTSVVRGNTLSQFLLWKLADSRLSPAPPQPKHYRREKLGWRATVPSRALLDGPSTKRGQSALESSASASTAKTQSGLSLQPIWSACAEGVSPTLTGQARVKVSCVHLCGLPTHSREDRLRSLCSAGCYSCPHCRIIECLLLCLLAELDTSDTVSAAR